MKFPCTKCGACCKNPVIADVCPELDRGDGVCVHLTDENECAIYETRPDYCRLDVLYSQRYADRMTEDEFCEWYSHNVCHNLQMHGAELEENRQKNCWLIGCTAVKSLSRTFLLTGGKKSKSGLRIAKPCLGRKQMGNCGVKEGAAH